MSPFQGHFFAAVILLIGQQCTAWAPKGLDPFEVLGIKRTPTVLYENTVKIAYRKAALRWHPDKLPPERKEEAEQRFIEIAWAYEELTNPVKRKVYEEEIKNMRPGAAPSPTPKPQPSPSPAPQPSSDSGHGGSGFSDFNMDKAAKVFHDVFGEKSQEFQDLIAHMVRVSRTGTRGHWKEHAKDVAKAAGSGEDFVVETTRKDGKEHSKTSRTSRQQDGSVTNTTVTHHTVTSSSSSNNNDNNQIDHAKIHELAHAQAMAAHEEAMSEHNRMIKMQEEHLSKEEAAHKDGEKMSKETVRLNEEMEERVRQEHVERMETIKRIGRIEL